MRRCRPLRLIAIVVLFFVGLLLRRQRVLEARTADGYW